MKRVLFFFLSIIPLFAQEFRWSGNVGVSHYTSTSHEFVYEYDYSAKLSELIWKIEDLPLLDVGVHLRTSKDITLSLKYSTKIGDINGQIDDYDWLADFTTDWSDWSTHPNTKIKDVSILDIYATFPLKNSNSKNKYSFKAGIKNTYHKFEAWDGSYIYSTDLDRPRDGIQEDEFRDNSGLFSGLGITYEENFFALYTKGEIQRDIGNFSFQANITFSPYVSMENIDTHHIRSFTNTNSFESTMMYGYGLGFKYRFTNNFLALFYYEANIYDETHGTTSRTYYADNTTDGATAGETFVYSGAGISNKSNTSSFLQFQYNF
jgi:plasminogen activator